MDDRLLALAYAFLGLFAVACFLFACLIFALDRFAGVVAFVGLAVGGYAVAQYLSAFLGGEPMTD